MTISKQLPEVVRATDYILKQLEEVQATTEIKMLNIEEGVALLLVKVDVYEKEKSLFSVLISTGNIDVLPKINGKEGNGIMKHRRFNLIKGEFSRRIEVERRGRANSIHDVFSFKHIAVMVDKMKMEINRRYTM